MKIQHIILDTGDAATIVNDMVVMTGDSSDDSSKLVETVAENLAQACCCSLQRITMPAPNDGNWSWEKIVMSLQYTKRSSSERLPSDFCELISDALTPGVDQHSRPRG